MYLGDTSSLSYSNQCSVHIRPVRRTLAENAIVPQLICVRAPYYHVCLQCASASVTWCQPRSSTNWALEPTKTGSIVDVAKIAAERGVERELKRLGH